MYPPVFAVAIFDTLKRLLQDTVGQRRELRVLLGSECPHSAHSSAGHLLARTDSTLALH